MLIGGVRDRTLEALNRYGDRAYLVLKAALEVSLDYASSRKALLGDFDYKGLVRKLMEQGVSYNPSPLLRALEREYGIIETSYRSGNQHWWRFIDRDAVREALAEYEGVSVDSLSDPRVEVIRIQIASLDLPRIKKVLENLLRKERLSDADKRLFRRIAFSELEDVAVLLEKAVEYEDVLAEEVKMLREVLSLASMVSRKISRPYLAAASRATSRVEVVEAFAVEEKPNIQP